MSNWNEPELVVFRAYQRRRRPAIVASTKTLNCSGLVSFRASSTSSERSKHRHPGLATAAALQEPAPPQPTASLTALNVTDTILFMATNSRMASAVHIMSFVAYAGDEGKTSEAIAKSLQTNPVVVRKILKLLEREGLVALRQGRHGGVSLRHPASGITLGQIYKAFEKRAESLRCPAKCIRDAWWSARWNEGLAQSSTLRATLLSRLSAKRVWRSWYAASAKFARNCN